MTELRFTGTTSVVTGAGGGIGQQIAQDLLDAGVNVCALDLKAPPEYDRSSGTTLMFRQADVTDRDAVDAAIAEARSAFDGIDYLVCAAGIALIGKDAGIVEVADDIVDKTIDINLGGVITLIRATMDDLKASPVGAIVNIASIAGLRGAENIEDGEAIDAYQMSKAAVVSLSKSVALQYAKHGVRCNTVCPGAIWTPMTDEIYQDPTRVEAMAARTPLRRVGKPEDISYATMFLLADQASFITGTDIISDGGIMARL